MSKPKFYQAVLVEVEGDVFDHAYPNVNGEFSLEERMGDKDAKCPDCGNNKWVLLPKESAAVREGGKPYCECMNCGFTTHL